MKKKIKLGLLGNNLSKSRAKYLHEMLGDIYNLDLVYENIDLKKNNLDFLTELENCKKNNFSAVNITHPYKQIAYQQAEIDNSLPKNLFSINTIVFNKESKFGTNTDFTGFVKSMLKKFGKDFSVGKVFLMGAGGVAYAIAFGIAQFNIKDLVIYDEDLSKSKVLADLLNKENINARYIEKKIDISNEVRSSDGLINATPLGMYQYPGNAFNENDIKNQSWSFDAVYTPENTEFMKVCRKLNMQTLSGFQLFLHQGLDAFFHFTGIKTNSDEIEDIFLKKFPDTLI